MEKIETHFDSKIDIKKANSTNAEIQSEDTEARNYSIWEIEEFLKNGQLPPGIKTYEDMPPEIPLEPSESKISKVKKPWETQENIEHFKNLFTDDDSSLKESSTNTNY